LLGIGDLIGKIAVVCDPCLYGHIALRGIRDFCACFDGIVQCVRKKAAETDRVNADQLFQINVEKAVDPFLLCQIVFCIEHRVDNAVFAEGAGARGRLRLDFLHIPLCLIPVSGLEQGAYDAQMVVHIMAEFTDLGLIVLQLFVITFQQHQVLPIHILADAGEKIFCKDNAS